MNKKTLALFECGRGEFTKKRNIVLFDRLHSKLINRTSVCSSENIHTQVYKTAGFFYQFYDWNKNIKHAALFLENDQLIFNFENNEYKIKNVQVTRFLLWKKIIINDLTVKVYSPIRTIFIATDMFPEDVEPIYGQFLNLLTTIQVQDFIDFLKQRNS